MDPDAIYVDHGCTGTQPERPGPGKALAACRNGDTLVVTKLDRLARSLPDARDVADELTRKGVALNLGGSIYDPHDPVGKPLFDVLMVAEFEADLIRARTTPEQGKERPRPRATSGKATETFLSPGNPTSSACIGMGAHNHRDSRTLRRRPLHGLPGHSTRRVSIVTFPTASRHIAKFHSSQPTALVQATPDPTDASCRGLRTPACPYLATLPP